MTTPHSSQEINTRAEDSNTPLDTVLHRHGFILVSGLSEYGLFGLKRRVGDGLLATHIGCYAVVDRWEGKEGISIVQQGVTFHITGREGAKEFVKDFIRLRAPTTIT